MEQKIFVYISIAKQDYLLGTIYVDNIRGKETYSFEYSDYALNNQLSNYIIDEDIVFTKGRQFKIESSIPYHFLEDSSPDRWGRNLIKKSLNNKSPQFVDYLLGVSDISRMGAYRYKVDVNQPFLAENIKVPPLKFLNEIESIAYHYDEFDDSDEWKILLSASSSMGGARPKATFYDAEGNYFLAKFTHKNDNYDLAKVEYLTYLLAKKVGIKIEESKLIEINSKRSVFLTKRFDRDKEERFHYVSFMTLLNAQDGESNDHSYLEMAEILTKRSSTPKEDLNELFKRIAFSILVHNYDDHLRNHGMLYKNNKWQLSPCFDINIVPSIGKMTLSVDGTKDTIEALIDSSIYFRLDEDTAAKIVNEIKKTIKLCLKDMCEQIRIEKNLEKRICELLLDNI